jgi:hypothetical protein
MLRPRKNEIYVGIFNADQPQPYEIWCADLWECPECGAQTILGYGKEPFSKHFHKDFSRQMEFITHLVDSKLKSLPGE